MKYKSVYDYAGLGTMSFRSAPNFSSFYGAKVGG